LCLFALFQGCEPQNNSGAKQEFRIAVVSNVPDPSNAFWSLLRRGGELCAEAAGNLNLEFCFVTNATVEAQQQILRSLIEDGVDGIAVSPIDGEEQIAVLNEIAAKTLLVCVDSDAVGSKRVCYIGSDNVAAGRQAADLIKAALPEGGKIALFAGHVAAQNASERIEGIQGELTGSNIQIVDILEDGGRKEVAMKNVEETMARHPDLVGMVGIYGYDGPAILATLRKAGRVGEIKIVCFDDYDETMAGVAAGEIYGTVVQRPFEMGLKAIYAMEHYLAGDKSHLAEGKSFLPTLPVTNENLEPYQVWRNHRLGR
jgi:ribose transport system substrate-binding protein